VGEEWHTIYRYAMDNGFRFLSYGDSSLLMIDKTDATR
jgi:S-adenosylmethionine:tRNA ribosyltransferase-isomerase